MLKVLGFLGSSAGKECTCNSGDPAQFLGQEVPLEKGLSTHSNILGLPCGSDSKESACSVGGLGSIPGLGRSLEGGMAAHSSILAWSIPKDKGAWWASPCVCKELEMTEQLKHLGSPGKTI